MDKIVFNGNLSESLPAGIVPGRLLSAPYVYQRIHTFEHRPLHPELHLSILSQALHDIHGIDYSFPTERLEREIAALLAANRFPKRSNCVVMRVFPQGFGEEESGPDYLLEAAEQLFYPPYTLWHKRLLLDVFRCDHPWQGYPTAMSLLAARYAGETALCRGADAAVLETGEGTLTGIDDEPLFAVFGRQVMTTPLACGANDSVMRRLILGACRSERMTVTEFPLNRKLLGLCEEAFTVSVQGIVSILGYLDRRYFNTTAVKLSERLRKDNPIY